MRLQAARELKNDTTQALSGVVADQVISNEFAATGALSRAGIRVEIEYTAAITGSITAKLQHGIAQAALAADGVSALVVWHDVGGTRGQAALATNASPAFVALLMHPGVASDAAQLPLRNKLRVVLTSTNAADAASVKMITVYEEELDARHQGALRSH